VRALGGDLASSALPAAVAFSTAVAVPALDGGYFPSDWGWPALALGLLVLSVVLLRDEVELGPLELVAVGGLAGLVAWVGLSLLWSPSYAQPLLELERDLLYLLALVAFLLSTPRRAAPALLGGLLAGIVAVSGYALATRLVPDLVGHYSPEAGYQLAEPFGYWNALAAFVAIGILLALGAVAHIAKLWVRVAAAVSLVVLGPTLYFTFSRGGWAVLAVAVAVLLAVGPERGRIAVALALTLPAPALAVALASRSDPLTRQGFSLDAAAHDGHEVALALVPLAVLAALLQLARARVPPLRLGRRGRLAVAAAGLAVAIACLGVAVARVGGPTHVFGGAVDAFGGPARTTNGDLNQRLVSLSGKGRTDYWRVAWDQYREAPLLGTGAGSFERFWLRDRPNAFFTKDAHQLYLETLAELGPLGLLLLLAALLAPVAAAVRRRRLPLVGTALAAYFVYLLHAALDWDWEMPGLTLAALACGGALLVAARPDAPPRLVRASHRLVAAAVVIPLLALVVVAQVGNGAVAAADRALQDGKLGDAAASARRARSWAPWSYVPWQQLGEIELREGRAAAARHSLHEALERDPLQSSVWVDLALASRGRARAKAVEEIRRLDPRSPELNGLVP
jgi:O-Antigen ligase